MKNKIKLISIFTFAILLGSSLAWFTSHDTDTYVWDNITKEYRLIYKYLESGNDSFVSLPRAYEDDKAKPTPQEVIGDIDEHINKMNESPEHNLKPSRGKFIGWSTEEVAYGEKPEARHFIDVEKGEVFTEEHLTGIQETHTGSSVFLYAVYEEVHVEYVYQYTANEVPQDTFPEDDKIYVDNVTINNDTDFNSIDVPLQTKEDLEQTGIKNNSVRSLYVVGLDENSEYAYTEVELGYKIDVEELKTKGVFPIDSGDGVMAYSVFGKSQVANYFTSLLHLPANEPLWNNGVKVVTGKDLYKDRTIKLGDEDYRSLITLDEVLLKFTDDKHIDRHQPVMGLLDDLANDKLNRNFRVNKEAIFVVKDNEGGTKIQDVSRIKEIKLGEMAQEIEIKERIDIEVFTSFVGVAEGKPAILGSPEYNNDIMSYLGTNNVKLGTNTTRNGVTFTRNGRLGNDGAYPFTGTPNNLTEEMALSKRKAIIEMNFNYEETVKGSQEPADRLGLLNDGNGAEYGIKKNNVFKVKDYTLNQKAQSFAVYLTYSEPSAEILNIKSTYKINRLVWGTYEDSKGYSSDGEIKSIPKYNVMFIDEQGKELKVLDGIVETIPANEFPSMPSSHSHWVDEDGKVFEVGTKITKDMKLTSVNKTMSGMIHTKSGITHEYNEYGPFGPDGIWPGVKYGETMQELYNNVTDMTFLLGAGDGATGPLNYVGVGLSLTPNGEVLPLDYEITDEHDYYVVYERTGINVKYHLDTFGEFKHEATHKDGDKILTPKEINSETYNGRFLGWATEPNGEIKYYMGQRITSEMLKGIDSSQLKDLCLSGSCNDEKDGVLELYGVYAQINLRSVNSQAQHVLTGYYTRIPTNAEYAELLREAGVDSKKIAILSNVETWEYRGFNGVERLKPGQIIPEDFYGDEFGQFNLTVNHKK